jgi:hypothetical protein
MALTSAVRGIVSRRRADFDARMAIGLPALWSALLTLLIAGPWLGGGYIFGTDWPGPRRFDYPTDLSSSAPLLAALALVSHAASGEVAGKVFVIGLLFLAAFTAYRAAPAEGFVAGAIASTVYVANPFVYGRLLYGQMFLLAGYALLPWVAVRIRRLLVDPGPINGVLAAAGLGLVGIASAHLFVIAVVLAVVLLITHVVGTEERADYLKRLAPGLIVAAVAALAASAYWVIPLVAGRGAAGTQVAAIGASNVSTFAVIPDQQVGLIPNVLGLYGFWAEGTGRFTSMKAFVPLWPAFLAVVLVIAGIGALSAARQRRDRLELWVAGLLVSAVIAVVLEIGVSHPLTSGLVLWLDTHVPVYRGMRDAGKWSALLAFVYSQLVALGGLRILDATRARLQGAVNGEWAVGIGTGLLLAVPLSYGNGVLFGVHGEIKPSAYPPGWYAADRALAADGHPGRTLFLPWHEYMSLSFVQNQNSVVVSPAPQFFSTPVLVSANPEVPGLAAPANPDQVAISDLVKAGEKASWAQALAGRNVKYVLLAREADWASYGFLEHQPGIVLVGDYGSIVLYRNSLLPP